MSTNTSQWIYSNNATNTVRYTLGEKANKMVACIGINPSTAEPDNLDNTLKSVKRIATYNGFDGWLMLNVYPQRATNPNDLDTEINNELRLANTKHICTAIRELKIDTIWVAYGDLIDSRNYLPFCMADIFKELGSDLNWKIIGVPTKKGHPRHPLYKPTKSKLVDFNMEHYVTEKLRQLNLEGIV